MVPVSTPGQVSGGENSQSSSFLLLRDVFSEGVQQGSKDSFNGTPLRGVDRMIKAHQMAFSGPAEPQGGHQR